MFFYHPAGQDFYFAHPVPELKPFEITDTEHGVADEAAPCVPYSFHENELISRTKGWVGSAQRITKVYKTSPGILLKVEGCGEFFIASQGETISKLDPQGELSQLDREIIVGPALVLALALRGVWSLHASAAMYKETVILFLGESGQGKSTLAAYLSQSARWRLVADDILPVTADSGGMEAWPHFPQLKLPIQEQPGPGLMEHISINSLCLLETTARGKTPGLKRLSLGQATRTLLSHTAGTRLFDAELLGRHLDFCAHSAAQVPVYRLAYPHRRDALPVIKELLESLC